MIIVSIGCVSASDDFIDSSSSLSNDCDSVDLSSYEEISDSITSSDSNANPDSQSSIESVDSLDSVDSTESSDDSPIVSNDENELIINDSSISKVSSLETDSSLKTDHSLKVLSKDKTPKKTKIKVNKINAYYKEKSRLNIALTDSNNQALKNKKVKIFLNGKTLLKWTDKNGNIKFLLNLKPGNYNVKILFESDGQYEMASASTKAIIKKTPLLIKAKNFSTYYRSDIFFKAKVMNKITKNPVEGIKVLFKVYSSRNKYKNYYSITNEKGVASLNKNLKVGSYDVFTYLRDAKEKSYLKLKNLKNKARLKVKKTAEVGCSSIYVYLNENESAVAFRRDSTYAAKLYVVAQKWHGRHAIKQYKLTGTYFFHTIATSDGWLIGTGGWDNPYVNRKIEKLAGEIVSSKTIKASKLKSIRRVEANLPTGHFAIVAPNGKYAVVWRGGYIRGQLKSGEYLDVPNVRSLFRHGDSKKFSSNPATAAHKIAATDVFGVNRRNIMVYHYKRTSKDFKTNSTVTVYGSNDKGNLIGRYTAALKDNVLFFKKFISKNSLYGTPSKKLLGTHKFGNIDKLIKTKTTVYAPNITGDFNQSKYFKVTLKNKKTNKVLKKVKITLRIYTGKNYTDYIVKTDKNGVAKFNTKLLNAGTHKVVISPANHKYIISKKSKIVINKVENLALNSTA